jgi:hypothetical protein
MKSRVGKYPHAAISNVGASANPAPATIIYVKHKKYLAPQQHENLHYAD